VRLRVLGAGLVAVIGSVGVATAAQLEGTAAQTDVGGGAFYVNCAFSHRAPDDAIVFPGQPGRSHLHDFIGNRTTDAFSTAESLRAGTTTCNREADRAAYWVPTLYEGELRVPVKVKRGIAAYHAGQRDVRSIQPFPEGFRMIAGDSSATEKQPSRIVDWICTDHKPLDQGRSPDDSPRAQALRAEIAKFDAAAGARRAAMLRIRRANRGHLRAIRRQLKAIRRMRKARGARAKVPLRRARALRRHRRALVRGRSAYRRERRLFLRNRSQRRNREAALQSYLFGGGTSIPTCGPGAYLEVNVKFPDCWDGRNLDSADHKSHVAYAMREGGKWVCPRSHPVLLPVLRLEVAYESSGGPDVRLSPGDIDAGHADFMNGWDQETLANLVRECLNEGRNCGAHNPQGEAAPQPKPQPRPKPQPDPDPDPLPLPLP
jgi:hypothetical protein